MDTRTHEVDFGFFCKHCLNWSCSEWNDPCNSCLDEPMAIDSRRPLFFKQDPSKEDAIELLKRMEVQHGQNT